MDGVASAVAVACVLFSEGSHITLALLSSVNQNGIELQVESWDHGHGLPCWVYTVVNETPSFVHAKQEFYRLRYSPTTKVHFLTAPEATSLVCISSFVSSKATLGLANG